MAKGKRGRRRRHIDPPDIHTPEVTPLPLCEAKDCGELLPLYGVQLPGLERKVWLCHTHFRYWQLDAMRAQTRAWQKEQEFYIGAVIEQWASDHVSLTTRLEVEGTQAGPAPEWKTVPVEVGGEEIAVAIRQRGPVLDRFLDWGAARRIGQVVLDG